MRSPPRRCSTGRPTAQAEAGVDECGLTTLAGRTIGAPFVGAATTPIVVAALLRMTFGLHRYEVIDGSLRSLSHRQAMRSELGRPFTPRSTRAV